METTLTKPIQKICTFERGEQDISVIVEARAQLENKRTYVDRVAVKDEEVSKEEMDIIIEQLYQHISDNFNAFWFGVQFDDKITKESIATSE